jgi:AraC-like DNA-binding protein
MENYSTLRSLENRENVESNGIILCMKQEGIAVPPGIDMMYPYIILSLNLSGTSHCLYDMKDIRAQKNDLTFFLPGHIIRHLEPSEDYTQAWLLFDPSKFKDSELKFNPSDMELLSQSPICHLTDEQAENLLLLLGAINYIASRSEEELPNKHRLLEQQLSVAYELYMSIRHEQDTEWNKDRMGHIYLTFCNLVVEHHKEERNVNYYAKLLGYDPRYFSKIFRAYNDGTSPLEWIQNYVTNQAKRMISEHPEQSIKEVSIQLGFPTTANFCRYFKRATGIYPLAYKEALSTSEDA